MTDEGSDTAGWADFDFTLDDIIDDSEGVVGTLVSRDGLTYEDSGESRHEPGPVVVVATDRRVVFATEDGRDVDAGSLEYGEVASVDAGNGEVALATTDGVRCVLTPAETGCPDSTVSHLRWVGELRNRLVSCRNDVELAAGEIREHASAMKWEEASERYGELRDRLDRLVDAVQWTRPIPDPVVAPELTPAERTLERAAAQLHVARAESDLRLARQLADTGRFGQAGSALETARTHADRARSHAACAERGDGFQFGDQRSVRTALDRLSSDIETLAESPRRAAEQALEDADDATDSETAVEHLETALQRYRDTVDIEAGGDPDETRHRLATVGGRLVDRYRDLAREHWNTGADLSRSGDSTAAIECWIDAVTDLERAVELAREFDHEGRDAIEAELERVEGTLANMRAHGTEDSEESDDLARAETGESGGSGPSLETDLELSPGPTTDAITDGSGLAGDR